MSLRRGERYGREAVLGRLDDRRKRCEGEGAWENRGMALVPFYNSGDLWQDACASVPLGHWYLSHLSPFFPVLISAMNDPQKAVSSCFIMADYIY